MNSTALTGITIAVTCPPHQAEGFQALLECHGAHVLHCPTIVIQPVPHHPEVTAIMASVTTYDWLVFTSVNAVRQFMAHWHQAGLESTALQQSVNIAAVGPTTRQALLEFRLPVHLVPPQYTAVSLFSALQERLPTLSGVRFFLPRGDRADNALPDAFMQAGAKVTLWTAYHTVNNPDPHWVDGLRNAIKSQSVDVITFASGSAVSGLAQTLGAVTVPETVKLAAIGPVTAAAVRHTFGRLEIEAAIHTLEGLTEAIVHHYVSQTKGVPVL